MDNILIREYGEVKHQALSNNPYSCLDTEKIDINPHQIEAFVFTISAIFNGGVILADEVGLGKTIEAGLVLKYLLNKGYKNILLILPASLRKQWQIELDEKFSIHAVILDSQNLVEYHGFTKDMKGVVITSYNFAAKQKAMLSKTSWDLIIFDEAHRLRNIHKNNSITATKLFEFSKGIPKLMLTATPMQNTLLDMFGLVQFIDEKIFLDKRVFSRKYMKNQDYAELQLLLEPILQRTLRSEVAEYLQFKSRICITVDFTLTPLEGILYKMVNDYLKKQILYAIPVSNRSLITMVIRKLLASSSSAVASTFTVLKERLEKLKETTMTESVDKSLDFFFDFLDDDYDVEEVEPTEELYDRERVNDFIQHEIDEIEQIITVSNKIQKNAKLDALQKALSIAFEKQREIGTSEKVVVFTESVRTQSFLFEELSALGFDDAILLFNGSMNDSKTKEIYRAWKSKKYGEALSSRSVEIKNAVVDAFKNDYKILLVTDSGSEGLNLQFCNTVINYDLPWNPQRIEQRIGRCHRYSQKNDVVVINLLNTENVADKRVYDILSQKFELFQGVFGASDKAIGLLESGENFEKRVLQIYQHCKNPAEFNKEFKALEKDLDRKRNIQLKDLKTLTSRFSENDHKKEFEKILKDIDNYLKDKTFWTNISKVKSTKHYPITYKMNRVIINGLTQHGYIIIGEFYNKYELLSPVLKVFDLQCNPLDLSENEIIGKLSTLNDNELTDYAMDPYLVTKCVNIICKEELSKYYKKYEKMVESNNVKIDNWVSLRQDEYNLRIGEIRLKMDKINVLLSQEKNFREKIKLKKKIDQLKQKQDDITFQFHDYMAQVQLEANDIKQEFEKQFAIDPMLVTRVLVQF